MKKFLITNILILFLNSNAFTEEVRNFKIEGMSIGDSALNYFEEDQLQDGEQDWFNYNYKEYATSLLPGKGIYKWFQVSYKSDDDKYVIEGLVGIVEKRSYNDVQCNKELDTEALIISKLFKDLNQSKKKLFRITYDSSKIFYEVSNSGKNSATIMVFNFLDNSTITLACYDMDKSINEIETFFTNINQFDSFRIDIKSLSFINFLKKKNYEKIY